MLFVPHDVRDGGAGQWVADVSAGAGMDLTSIVKHMLP